MSEAPINKTNNRKRKKSFLKNARKYGKRGYYGRGSELDADIYQYLVRIMEAYNQGFENEEEKLMFINNVFEQMDNKEIICCSNQVGCRVVETLLPFANKTILKKFMEAFISDIRKLSNDRFASHVLEALIKVSTKMSLDVNCDEFQHFKEFSLKISKFLLNNLEDYIWDTYGNHVMRTCLENLSQLPKEDIKGKKEINTDRLVKEERLELPKEYLEIINEYGERLITWPQFNELCFSEISSGFLQVLLKCLSFTNKKLLKRYLKKLLDELFCLNDDKTKSNILPQAFLSKSVIMLLETSIQVCSSKILAQIYKKCFSGMLVKLSTTRNTNFAVQKLIQRIDEKVAFEEIFEEVADHFEDIIDAGHAGILLSLAQSCKNLKSKQGSFVQNLMKSLHCLEPEERQDKFVLCLSRFVKFEEPKNSNNSNLQKEKLNLQGTLILQCLLDFNKPIKIVNAILNMDVNELKDLFSNTMGSHIVDSYVKSLYVGEKSREKLVKKISGKYQDLAATKYGSRSFEALWSAANFKAKFHIMEELSYKDGAWSHSEHGKIIASKINLLLFKRNKEDWKNSLNKLDKKDKILEEILK